MLQTQADRHNSMESNGHGIALLSRSTLPIACIMTCALTFSTALDEEAISHLHDVGLVDSCYFVPVVVSSILESILSDSCAGNSGDDLQRERHQVIQQLGVMIICPGMTMNELKSGSISQTLQSEPGSSSRMVHGSCGKYRSVCELCICIAVEVPYTVHL